MKKTFLYGAALFSLSLSAQQQPSKQRLCGFDQILEQDDRSNPGAREAVEDLVRKIKVEQKKNPSAFKKTVNGVYEIPVVVHVIEGGDGGFSRTDAQIQTWIENANKMYAGTYPWPSNGVPTDFGTSAVFPIKLVLAKRTPNCTETTGIVRYNGSSLPGYTTYGMAQQTANGATRVAIKNLAPHWPEASYFNIYLINMFDGDATPNAGLMGFAAFPTTQDSQYESFMKAGTVTNLHDTTFAHEFGHAMGLYHTFQGGDYEAPTNASTYCPPSTGDCTKDNDMVCDTERAGAAYYGAPPSNAQINPCTQTNYQGVQYNMMNYTNSVAQKFTPGQGERIDGLFMLLRSSLTSSKGATPISAPTGSTTPIAACAPTGVTNIGNYFIGPTSVKLGEINNATKALYTNDPTYYVDYTSESCLKKIHTNLTVNQPQTIEVGIYQNPQYVRVWIDYNNNGVFEDSELVASGDDVPVGADLKGTFTGTFTPPSTAVMNTPLRMRVIAEGFDEEDPITFATCGQLNYGQAEDYSVTLLASLATNEVKANSNDDLVIYPNPVATGDKIFIKAKNGKNLKVSISDMAGRVVSTPAVAEEGNGIYKVTQQLEKGVYMMQISNGKESKTSKLIIK